MFENKRRDKQDRISLAISLVIVVLEVVALIMVIRSMGWGMFVYYTQDSNLLLLIASAIWAFCCFRRLRDGVAIPQWVRVLKFAATGTVFVTFVVVIAVLVPMGAGSFSEMLFDGSMLFCHTLCPILAVVSFVLFEGEPRLEVESTAAALCPTVVYAIVAIIMNLIGAWYGPYPFLHIFEQPAWISLVWVILLGGGAWFLAWLLYQLNRLATREYVY